MRRLCGRHGEYAQEPQQEQPQEQNQEKPDDPLTMILQQLTNLRGGQLETQAHVDTITAEIQQLRAEVAELRTEVTELRHPSTGQ